MTHEIITGDCIEVMRGWDREQAALVFADPPYNLGVDYGQGKNADKVSEGEFYSWSYDWLNVGMRRITGSVAWVLTSRKWASCYREFLGCWADERNRIIWHETFGNYRESNFAEDHRHLLYFVRNMANHTWNPDAIRVLSARQTKYKDKRANPKGRVPGNVWTFPRVCGTFKERVDWHPCQLPQAMLERIILSTTNPGDLVVDIFSGSGSMGIVCIKHGRRFIGIELNPEYVARSRDRLDKAEAQA